ncbi:MAG: hypothetical protein GWP19_06455 [Planctomycetia bacterium]|nr:hypothetical protein [Planctomycetia bacterium]
MITSEERGRQASIDGFAHEHIVCGILMKRYQNVSLVDLPLSPYDIIIVFNNDSNKEVMIRAQVKTARTSVSFTGGTRGGVDREYKSGVKTYTQSTKTSDVVIGYKPITDDQFELYFVPTILIEKLKQKSISLSKISFLKNNYKILENSKNRKYVIHIARQHKLIH